MTQTSYAQAGTMTANVTTLTKALAGNPSLQAFWALRVGFTIAPIVAGLDKGLSDSSIFCTRYRPSCAAARPRRAS